MTYYDVDWASLPEVKEPNEHFFFGPNFPAEGGGDVAIDLYESPPPRMLVTFFRESWAYCLLLEPSKVVLATFGYWRQVEKVDPTYWNHQWRDGFDVMLESAAHCRQVSWYRWRYD